MTMTYLTHH